MNENRKKKKLKNGIMYAFSFWPLILSHHPVCDRFSGHTLNIGRIRFCIGCFIGYPTALLGIFLIEFFKISNLIPYENFLWIGIIFLSTFILSLLNLTKIKIIKIIQKIIIGLGASFIFWWIWYGNATPQVKLFTFSYVFSIIIGGLNIYHVYGFFRTCYKCETPFSWGKCPGFSYIRNHEYLFSSMDDYSKKLIEKRKNRKNRI
jgi:hypothetical protein